MSNYTGFVVEKLPQVNPGDERGPIYSVFTGENMEEVAVSKRKAGSIAGNHFHKGESPSRRPEINFIVDGKGYFEVYDWRNERRYFKTVVEEGDLVRIEPGVYHTLHAVTDITLIERMVVPFDKNNSDIYQGLDQYKEYIESLKVNS